MTRIDYDLAHFNLAFAKHPLDHPDMTEFRSQLETVNRRAAASAGFVWTAEEGDTCDPAVAFGDPLALANLSTWRSVEELRRFVYDGLHGQALKRRREWFQVSSGPAYVLWWVPRGARPTFEEAKARLARLAAEGPTPFAFTFAAVFPPAASHAAGAGAGPVA